MQLFTGCYTHAVDAKNRVSVPRKIVDTLRRLGAESEVVLTAGLDGCLFLYTPEGFAAVADQVSERPLGEDTTRQFMRTFYSSAETCSLDRNGRILLPEALKSRAGIGDKVVFAGLGRHVELWEPGAWTTQREATEADYEAQAKDVFK